MFPISITTILISNYNSRYRPAEVLWYNGEAHLIRKRETFEDLTRNQLEMEFDSFSKELSGKK